MDVSRIITHFDTSIPHWVVGQLAAEDETLATLEDRVRLVNLLAAANYLDGGGGPFAAIVVEKESGRLVAAGVNRVLASGLSAMHAEVVALSLAQRTLGSWDLGSDGTPELQLVVNWRPCAQCYGAVMWSGVRSLVIAGEGPEVEELTGFDEGPMREDWVQQFEDRGIEVVVGVLRDEALAVFRDYGSMVASGRAQVYNARGTGRNLAGAPAPDLV